MLNKTGTTPILIKLPFDRGKQGKYINPVSASVRSMQKIKQGNGIESDGGEYLGWVNREGSTEEEKFKPHSEKKLPLREQGRSTLRELQVQKD